MFDRSKLYVGAVAVALAASGTVVGAQKQKEALADNYDDLFQRYLQQARAVEKTAPQGQVPGWTWMTGLAMDRRARSLNDLITIHVVESITATGSADSTLTKASGASVAVPKLFGIEKKLPASIDPTSVVGLKTNTDFKGGGTTTKAGELSANMTARVSEVLPNGDLVVEGVREIDINGDRQIVVLSGVIRPADISPNNAILSTSVGQLRIKYFGRGLMKDNLAPGWLVRILNKVF